MLQHVRAVFNHLGKWVDELPQVEYIEPRLRELYWSYTQKKRTDFKHLAQVYPFSGNLQMKPAVCSLFTSEKAKIAENMLVISCSDYHAVRSNTVAYWLNQARNIKSFGNSLPAFNEHNPDTLIFETMILSLNVKEIVILGHTRCSAMKCLLAEAFLLAANSDGKPHSARAVVHKHYHHLSAEAQAEAMVQENVLAQMENLLSYPRLAKAIEQKRLQVHAWIFESETGKFHIYDADKGQFEKGSIGEDATIGM